MAALGPPLPPRRKAPPLPSRPISSQTPSIDSTPTLGGIAARIAALKLDQVGLGLEAKPSPRRSVSASSGLKANLGHAGLPTGVEDRIQAEDRLGYSARPNKINGHGEIGASPSSPSDTLTKAIGRPPPPPPRRVSAPAQPIKKEAIPSPPSLPPRKVPPLPPRRISNQTPPDTSPNFGKVDQVPPPPPARRLPPPFSRQFQSANADSSIPPTVNLASRPPVPHSTRPVVLVREPTPEPDYEPDPEEPSTDAVTESCLKCRSFEEVDAHAACFPRQNVESLEYLAHSLTSPFESLTDKARAIFTWLHHNIEYDVTSFLNNDIKPSTPESTLRSGLAVCEGYAGLFSNLGLHAGLQTLVVHGHGKGYGYAAPEGEASRVPPYEMNHAWNAVVMDDNQWHLIDSCWGAGALEGNKLNKRFAPGWFTSTNEEFGKKHFPTDERYQMREDGTVQTWEEYILAPAGPTEFGHFEMLGYKSEMLWPNTKCIAGGYQHPFHVEKLCWHMERRDWWEDYVLMLVASPNTEGSGIDGKREVMERDADGGWTATLDVPTGQGMVTLFIVNSLDGQDAKGVEPRQMKSFFGKRAMGFQAIARWEVQ